MKILLKQMSKTQRIYIISTLLLATVFLVSLFFGAVQISFQEILNALQHLFSDQSGLNLNERIFLEIRMPRAILTLFVGASLAIGGALMQGLFLNPIVEPGLIGTSSGAAFGAALYFTLGAAFGASFGEWVLPIVACIGGAVATFLVYFLSYKKTGLPQTTLHLLLVGIAINALFLSGVGFLSYIARDPQARSITFWNLGTLSGANWHAVIVVGISFCVGLILSLGYAKQLNALVLGEGEAGNIGVNVKVLKLKVLFVTVILVAIATAFTGVIAFVGLIVPHILRMLLGGNTKFLIVGGALAGGILVTAADLVARMVLAPAELPIGIVTTVVGAPIFIFLLRKNEYQF